MKLKIKTTNPNGLRQDIISSIENEELRTWSIVESEGETYIKHTKQWGEKGVIKLDVDSNNGYLVAKVLKFKAVTEEVKDFEGYYLGRFCELLFVNFSDRFTIMEKK